VFRAIAPVGEQLAQTGVAELLLARFKALLLHGQSLVEHEPARSSEAAHVAMLLAVGHQFIFEGLESLHVDSISSRRIRKKNYPGIRKKLCLG
jgi:hypothetical protein